MANTKFKVIFVDNKKKDGGVFTTMKTILKGEDGKDIWINILFDDKVNTKLFKGKNQICVADETKIHLPISLEPYKKDGVLKYPYVWVDEIISHQEYKYKSNTERKPLNLSFSMDAEDDNETLPFDNN